MRQTGQQPLPADQPRATQRESAEASILLYLAEDRFDDHLPPGVPITSSTPQVAADGSQLSSWSKVLSLMMLAIAQSSAWCAWFQSAMEPLRSIWCTTGPPSGPPKSRD